MHIASSGKMCIWCGGFPVMIVGKNTIQHWLCIWEQINHCLGHWDAHNAEKAQLQRQQSLSDRAILLLCCSNVCCHTCGSLCCTVPVTQQHACTKADAAVSLAGIRLMHPTCMCCLCNMHLQQAWHDGQSVGPVLAIDNSVTGTDMPQQFAHSSEGQLT